ncbi:uncharacterized protein CLIB1423_01S01640 [[Candida] railenensis]|uniref:DUF218 domain-containing protein n=1 Tax=[Candida] railenensis TaxID=45579 RepID=A0A9P0VVK8_9ASCO|nr:uncharacterized protein CLIB1423_01S01640 [[Candida] railenensis]
MDHLIILPCHSIWHGGQSLGQNKEEWSLAPFQHEGEDHLCFIDHIDSSLKLLETDPRATLIISGGQTKPEIEISESQSYLNLAKAISPDSTSSLAGRIALEEYARDSMENVIFSISRFFELHKRYPKHITVVGFEFKRSRFLHHHFKALKFPSENVHYIGNSPTPPESVAEAYFEDLKKSENRFAVKLFESDWFGVQEGLKSKKISRNPFNRTHSFGKSNPQLKEFYEELGSETASNESIQNKLVKWF